VLCRFCLLVLTGLMPFPMPGIQGARRDTRPDVTSGSHEHLFPCAKETPCG